MASITLCGSPATMWGLRQARTVCGWLLLVVGIVMTSTAAGAQAVPDECPLPDTGETLSDADLAPQSTATRIMQLAARRDCLARVVRRRFLRHREARIQHRSRRRQRRRARRGPGLSAEAEAEFLEGRAATQQALYALKESINHYRSVRRAHDTAVRRARPWRVLAGFDGAAWLRVRTEDVDTGEPAGNVRYRQPSLSVGVAYEAPVTASVALRLGTRVGLGTSRLGVEFSDYFRWKARRRLGPGFALMLDAGIRFRTRGLFAVGLEAQLRTMVPPDRSVRVDDQRLRLRNRAPLGVVFGLPLELTLGSERLWRFEVAPGMGLALNSEALIVRVATTLSYAF